MKAHLLPLLILIPVFSLGATAQDSQPPQGSGQRAGRGQWGGMIGNGVMGTVTEVAPDHFIVKTESGDLYTIHFSVNTRMMKGGGGRRREQEETQAPMPRPEAIKASDIKTGDVIGASGELDRGTKSVGAVFIFQIDPERAKQMREMEAKYGKTWLMGRVTAINDLKITLQGGPDNTVHTFTADENTTFRKRRDPITLADIQLGDTVRVEGALKNGAFVATNVSVMGRPPQDPSQPSAASPLPPPQ